MADLTAKQRKAIKEQLRIRLVLENKFKKELRRVFRAHVSTVARLVHSSGAIHFPPELRWEMSALLLKHYNRVARHSYSFLRNLTKKSWGDIPIETKVWNHRNWRHQPPPSNTMDGRMRTRISEIFDVIAQDKSFRIMQSTGDEITQYIKSIEEKAAREGLQISNADLAKQVRDLYYTRIESKISVIAITETTFALEKTKEVEAEEALDERDLEELDEEDLLALAEDGDDEAAAELLAMLEYQGVDGTESLTIEDIIAAGGIAAILASVQQTKTWVAILDSTTREDHADADGQEVAADEPFSVGGEELDYPGDAGGSPEQTINCRCTAVYSTGEEDSAE